MTFDLKALVIQLDENVIPKAKPTRQRAVDPRLASLQAMDVDTGKNSFFMPGAVKKDARSLIALGKKHGINLIARETKDDEIHHVAGTRVWRVSDPKKPFQSVPPEDDDF